MLTLSRLRRKAGRIFYRHAPEQLLIRWMIVRYQRASPEDIRVFDKYRDKGRAAVDIGANRGVMTHLLASRFARVYAFEPDPVMADFCSRNAPLNSTVYELALSDHEGTASLRTPVWEGEASRTHGSLSKGFDGEVFEETSVRMATLDSLDLGEVALIKIDVEGHELSVLRGAERTLKQQQPALWVEIERIHGDADHPLEVFEMLDNSGYQGSFWFQGRRCDLSEFEIDVHQPIRDDGVAVVGRVTNFLFVPRA